MFVFVDMGRTVSTSKNSPYSFCIPRENILSNAFVAPYNTVIEEAPRAAIDETFIIAERKCLVLNLYSKMGRKYLDIKRIAFTFTFTKLKHMSTE